MSTILDFSTVLRTQRFNDFMKRSFYNTNETDAGERLQAHDTRVPEKLKQKSYTHIRHLILPYMIGEVIVNLHS